MTAVKMYSTAYCPYCLRAKELLRQRGVEKIDEVDVDMQPGARAAMMDLTKQRTVPQIFIGDTYVGGCDELVALDRRGGLVPLLAGTA